MRNFVLVLWIALAGTGCAPGAPAAAPPTSSSAGRRPLLTYEPDGVQMTALHSGRLELIDIGGLVCTSLDAQTHLAWPAGYTTDGTSIFSTDGSEVARAGETVEVGGGYGWLDSSPEDRCGPQEEAWIVGPVVRRIQG